MAFAVRPEARRPQTPVFRATSELVEINATVTGKDGRPARGLTREDFLVSEDGVPQEIAQFAFVDIPRPATTSVQSRSAPAHRRDVSSNRISRDSRLYVIVLDAFHVDSSRSTLVRRLARDFITDSTGADDVVAVITIGGAASQPFTTDKQLLLDAVDRFVGHKARPTAVNLSADPLLRPSGSAVEDTEMGAKAHAARVMLATMKQVCESLGTSQGYRRSLVLFSEGIEFDTSDLLGPDQRPGAGQTLSHDASRFAGVILDAQRDMMVAARRANVALFTIDPRGSTIGQESIMSTSGNLIDPRTGRPLSPAQSLMSDAERSQGTLRVFAEQTGGLAVVNTNDISQGFQRIVDANSTYYVLAYRPTNVARDGAYRRIAVRVPGRAVNVTARKGYFAPVDRPASIAEPDETPAPTPNAPSPRMRALLASQLPVVGLGLRATGGALRMAGDDVLVGLVLEIEAKDLPFREQDGQIANDLEIAFVAIDVNGKPQAANRRVGNLRLPAGQRGAFAQGLRYVVEFPLPAGRYQVRVGAHEIVGDSGGSTILDLDASRLDRAPAVLGGVMLTSASAQRVPTTGWFDALRGALPTPPTAVREFAAGEAVTALVTAHGTEVAKGGARVAVSVVRETGEVVASVEVPIARADSAGTMVPVSVPTTGLAAGRYTITVELRVAAGQTASRTVPIIVR